MNLQNRSDYMVYRQNMLKSSTLKIVEFIKEPSLIYHDRWFLTISPSPECNPKQMW